MTLHTHPPPTTMQTQCQQYLSYYRPNFDQTLKVGFWDHTALCFVFWLELCFAHHSHHPTLCILRSVRYNLHTAL